MKRTKKVQRKGDQKNRKKKNGRKMYGHVLGKHGKKNEPELIPLLCVVCEFFEIFANVIFASFEAQSKTQRN